MFPEFMLYNFDMENDERVVDIKVRCLPLYFVVGVGVSVVFFFPFLSVPSGENANARLATFFFFTICNTSYEAIDNRIRRYGNHHQLVVL